MSAFEVLVSVFSGCQLIGAVAYVIYQHRAKVREDERAITSAAEVSERFDRLTSTFEAAEAALRAQITEVAKTSAQALSLLVEGKLPPNADRVMWVPDTSRDEYNAKLQAFVEEGIFLAEHASDLNEKSTGKQQGNFDKQRIAMAHIEDELRKASMPVDKREMARRIEVSLAKLKAEQRVVRRADKPTPPSPGRRKQA